MANLLNDLDEVAAAHSELRSPEVRTRLRDAVQHIVIMRDPDYQLPDDFGLATVRANARLRKVLDFNLNQLSGIFDIFGLDSEARRLSSFNNPKVHSDRGSFVADFFGGW